MDKVNHHHSSNDVTAGLKRESISKGFDPLSMLNRQNSIPVARYYEDNKTLKTGIVTPSPLIESYIDIVKPSKVTLELE